MQCKHMGGAGVHTTTLADTVHVETLCLPTRVMHMHMRMQVRVTQQLNQVFGSHDLSKK